MAVDDAPYRVGYGLVHIVTLYQHGINTRYGSVFEIPGSLQKLGESRIDGRRIAPGNRRFSRSQPNLPLGHCKPGQRVHHHEHIVALVLEIFRYGSGCKGAFHALHRRLIRCGHHQHRPCQPFFAQISFQKLTDFPASLTYQGDDVYVGFHVAGDHSKQCALAHSAAGENPHSLAFAYGKKSVYGLHPEFENLSDSRSRKGILAGALNLAPFFRPYGPSPVYGLSRGIDDPPDQIVGHADAQSGSRGLYKGSRAYALQLFVGHE